MKRRPLKRFFVILILLILAGIYLAQWGTIIFQDPANIHNSDFLPTYTATQIINAGQGAQLYDFAVQTEFQHAIAQLRVPPADLLPFIHPPFYALPFLGFGYFSYSGAYFSMVIFNIGLMGGVLFLFQRYLSGIRYTGIILVGLTCLAFFPFIVNLMQGQNAVISLFILTVVFIGLRQGQDYQAGGILALGLYKPQLVFVFVVVLLMKRQWQAILAFGGVALSLLGVSYLMIGSVGFQDYLNLTILNSPLQDGAYGVNYHRMHNWRALFRLWFGADQPQIVNGLTILMSLITIVLLIWAWRGAWQPQHSRFNLQYAITILATMLISPHLNTHDLTLWILVGALMIDYSVGYKQDLPKPLSVGIKTKAYTFVIVGVILSFVALILNEMLHTSIATLFMVAGMIMALYTHTRSLH